MLKFISLKYEYKKKLETSPAKALDSTCRENVFTNPFFPTVPCAVRETASLGIMGEPRVPPLNPSESIVL